MLLLIAIVILVLVATEIYSRWYKPPAPDMNRIMALARSLDAARLKQAEDTNRWQDSTAVPFVFNPNTLSDSGFTALGFSDREIQTLRKYLAAGGAFRIKSDFGKLYFVDEQVYQKLEAYIDLPETYPSDQKQHSDQAGKRYVKWSDTASYSLFKYEPFRVDLNKADTTELKELNGIGSFYARKIVEHREKLGGYYNIGQLLELWKMTPETIDKFAYQIVIDLSSIKKINVNVATAQELAAHPYIRFDLASRIVLQREQAGNFENLESLVGSGLLDGELSLKLAPYLDFK